MTKLLCTRLTLLLAVLSNVTALRAQSTLVAPQITHIHKNCESVISFDFTNSNVGSSTQIYRLAASGGVYTLIRTVPPGADGYSSGVFSDDVPPRTTYFYRLRAIKAGATSSPFSPDTQMSSVSDFYAPELSVRNIDDFKVEMTFVDKSYADWGYDVYVFNHQTSQRTPVLNIFASDSGSTHKPVFGPLTPNTTQTFYIDVTLRCGESGRILLRDVASASVTIPDGLISPEFSTGGPASGFDCEKSINIVEWWNPNEGSSTELYRSTSADGEYQLLATLAPGVYTYSDDVAPRTTHYYKLRAVKGEMTSKLSASRAIVSFSDIYNPLLTARAMTATTVELKLTDRTYGEWFYRIRRFVEGSHEYSFIDSSVPQLPDSGQTATIIDQGLQPNTNYIYRVDLIPRCDPGNEHWGVTTATLTTPDGIGVTSFTLIDPYTDQDAYPVYEGAQISYDKRYNIRANAVGRTESVAFYLNDQFHHIENEAPYSLFWDNKGDYNFGNLAPGYYKLVAIAYTGNNATGVKGGEFTRTFYVYKENTSSKVSWENNSSANIFPNPVRNQSMIQLSGNPGQMVRVDIIKQNGNATTLYQGKLDDAGQLEQELQAQQLEKGTYLLSVKFADKTFTRRFIVE